MGGKSLVWAVALVFALSLPAYAQKKNYSEQANSSRSEKKETHTTEVKAKVQKRTTVGDDTYLQEADTSQITKHFKTDTYTTYTCTWLESVTKSRTVTYEIERFWEYPCPPGAREVIRYGTRTETYEEDEPRSDNVTRLTNTSYSSEVQPKTTGSFRTVSRLSSGAIASMATAAGAAGAGRDIGFSGDTGSGSDGARVSSAGKTKKIAGATKAIKAGGAKDFDASGSYSGGGLTLVVAGKGGDDYDLTFGAFKTEAKFNRGKGKIEAGKGKNETVDLTFGNGGNSLTGTIRGNAVSLTKQ
ncbi:MAG: hypothetical protein FJZ01_03605 [Candidatus Sericytochromatia bacterium]|nr:hypothetical protein [Candidatus Tanganyikabacteria bacterium]